MYIMYLPVVVLKENSAIKGQDTITNGLESKTISILDYECCISETVL